MLYPAERFRVMAKQVPAGRAAGEYITDWLPMQQVIETITYIQTGAMGANAKFDAQLQQATDNVGTGVKAIAGKAITQLDVDEGDANDLDTIYMKADEMDAANNYNFIRLRMTVANAAVYCSAIVQGTVLRNSPDAQALITEAVG